MATKANEAEKTRVEETNAQKKRRIDDVLAESDNTGGKVAKLARQQTQASDSVIASSSAGTSSRSEQYNRFQAKILAIDKYAEIVDIKTIRHPKCGKKLAMKAKFNTRNFKTHVVNCKGPTKAAKLTLSSGGMRSINALLFDILQLLGTSPRVQRRNKHAKPFEYDQTMGATDFDTHRSARHI